jgi:hypothetical protein
MALSGKRIIEYPTFVIGPEEFLTKVEYFVKELSQSEQSEGEQIMGSPLASKRLLKETLSTNDPNEIDLSETPTKHPRLSVDQTDEEEDVGQPQESKNLMRKFISSQVEVPSDDEEEEEEDGCGEEFIKQLELLQSQDISSLQQLIVSMEDQTSSSPSSS